MPQRRALAFHRHLLAAVLAATATPAPAAQMRAGEKLAGRTTCTGALERMAGGFQVKGCNLTGANARRVLQVCSPGQQCVVTGTLEPCRGVRGACSELTHITEAHWGEDLPSCSAAEGIARADRYWQEGNSLLIDGTITSRDGGGSGDQAPYGHTKIIMDMMDCSGGSPMPIDHVPDRWIGHYVHVSGTAMKGVNGWYIVAKDVQAAD